MQDTEQALDGNGLFLNYGSIEDGEFPALAVGYEIVAALEQHGLETSWNGEWSRRIGIIMPWQRRR
jgi:hypothetical protein